MGAWLGYGVVNFLNGEKEAINVDYRRSGYRSVYRDCGKGQIWYHKRDSNHSGNRGLWRFPLSLLTGKWERLPFARSARRCKSSGFFHVMKQVSDFFGRLFQLYDFLVHFNITVIIFNTLRFVMLSVGDIFSPTQSSDFFGRLTL